jgi:hypothetical protein
MIPISTTDEQAKVFDAWKDETGNEYQVSIRKYDSQLVSMDLINECLQRCEKEHTAWYNPRKGKNPSGEETPGFRVLEVKDGMIVDALAQCKYMQCVK